MIPAYPRPVPCPILSGNLLQGVGFSHMVTKSALFWWSGQVTPAALSCPKRACPGWQPHGDEGERI